MEPTPRVLRGPFALAGWAIAAAWVVLGVFAAWRLGQPVGWAIAAAALVAAALTAWIARGLVVRLTDVGVSGSGLPEIAWQDIEHVGVRGRLVTIPFVAVHRGRALDDLTLDGIASPSRAKALALAHQVAEAGGLEVIESTRVVATGRRALKE